MSTASGLYVPCSRHPLRRAFAPGAPRDRLLASLNRTSGLGFARRQAPTPFLGSDRANYKGCKLRNPTCAARPSVRIWQPTPAPAQACQKRRRARGTRARRKRCRFWNGARKAPAQFLFMCETPRMQHAPQRLATPVARTLEDLLVRKVHQIRHGLIFSRVHQRDLCISHGSHRKHRGTRRQAADRFARSRQPSGEMLRRAHFERCSGGSRSGTHSQTEWHQ